MNKKILISGISIIATLSLFAGITYAQLTSTATGSGITFAAETAGLEIAVGSSLPALSSFGSSTAFNITGDVFPGFNQTYPFWLYNASGTDIPLSNVVTIPTIGGNPQDLSTNLSIDFNCTDEGTNGNTPGAVSSNSPSPLSSWTSGSQTIGTLASGEYASCTMNASIPTTVTTLTTGETVSLGVDFTGTQVESSVTPTPTPGS